MNMSFEQNRETKHIDSPEVHLSDISWSFDRDIRGENLMKIFDGEMSFHFGNEDIELYVEHAQVFNSQDEDRLVKESYEFNLGNKPSAELEGAITVHYQSDNNSQPFVTTNIKRNDPQTELPKGLGLRFYQTLLLFIQDIANKRNVSLKHLVSRHVLFSKTPLSNQRWDELFLPILQSEGYVEMREGKWEKQYQPISKAK